METLEEKRLIDQKLRDELAEINELMVLLDNPSFDNSIIGVTEDGAAVYSYERMVREYVQDEFGTRDPTPEQEDEARDFISYKTSRAIPYMKRGEIAPFVVFELYKIGGKNNEQK